MSALSVAQIEEGRVAVIENARDLLEEAKLLLSHGRHARAYSLAHLACEEAQKEAMLTRAGLESARGIDVDWSKLHRRLHDHVEKIEGVWTLILL